MNKPEVLLRPGKGTSNNCLLRRFLLLFAFLISGLSLSVSANGTIPGAEDLNQDARQSIKEEKPILVFFSSESCPYCEVVRDLYLEPMLEANSGSSRVIIREVSVDGVNSMRDFKGLKMDHQEFADREGASLTPVVRLYSPAGELLAPELLGYSSPDFYLGYLEQSIEIASKKIRKRTALNLNQ
jgi:thioredoxin-related protein